MPSRNRGWFASVVPRAAYAPIFPLFPMGARSTRKPISFDGSPQVAVPAYSTGVASIQARSTPPAAGVTVTPVGGYGRDVATETAMGRIMSISSWLRMWQCHTYSQPKSVMTLVSAGLIGLPFASTLLKPSGEPSGIIGLSGRTLCGRPNGSFGTTGRIATMVSSSGLIRTVSFQPSSFASARRTMPSQPTRLTSWMSNRWKWMGWVSTPLCVIFQSCVPSSAVVIGVTSTPGGSTMPSRSSLAGLTYGYRIRFCCWPACALGASRPRLPLMRPYSFSNASPISSWMALRCSGMVSGTPETVSNAKSSS
ncbi:hypothetical protein PSR1_03514 [Anaeromyxobacter sp. PSR-1]|nr:hypothetical protein PSR1_03514 [Anaeromyxobacter sp. PSR-1]